MDTTVPAGSVHDDQLTTRRALTAMALFSALAPAELEALVSACERIRLRPGEVLLAQGAAGDRLYITLAGQLRVTQRQPDGADLVLGDVLEGEVVGEGAVLARAPRMARVYAVADTTVLALSRDAVEALAAEHAELRSALTGTLRYRLNWAAARRHRPPRAELLTTLADFVGDLDPAALDGLERTVEWVTLPRGALLLKQGEPGDCVYFVVSGRLKVFARRADGSDVRIGEVGPGEAVGEMALLSGDVRVASVEAVRDCELLQLAKSGFDRLVAEHPQTMSIFTRTLVDRLERTIRSRSLVAQLRAAPCVTEEECEDVVATADLVLRNLKITQTYHRLSLELAALLGYEDVNWCNFACHASKTAGYAIRKESLPLYGMLRSLSRVPPLLRFSERLRLMTERRLGLPAWLEAISDEVSRQVSAGNLKVFAELAPIFARFVRTFREDADYERPKLDRFVGSLHRGPTLAGGQELLVEAMTHYYDAMFERRAKPRAELVLLGTIKVGLHEQIRLQPEILCALNAPAVLGSPDRLRRLSQDWAARVTEPGTPMNRLARWASRPAERIDQRLVEAWAALGRRIVTRTLMELRLPYGEIRLGADLPALPRRRPFPDMLETLENPQLRRLVGTYRRGVEPLRGSRALDWADLNHRMSFVVDLFRSRQKSLELFEQPFLLAQRHALLGNRRPDGPL